jgi:hypothetical protein
MRSTRSTLFALAAAFMLLATGRAAQAQPLPIKTYTYDEDGHGTLSIQTSQGTQVISYPGSLQPDPGPGGLPLALTYLVGAPTAMVVPGDLFLLEPGRTEEKSDVIRFNVDPQTGMGLLVFYSDNLDGADALADTGFPTASYANLLQVLEVGPEGNNGFTYHPTAGQPGFQTGFDATYNFISDAVPLPRAAWAGLVLLALLALTRLRHRHLQPL